MVEMEAQESSSSDTKYNIQQYKIMPFNVTPTTIETDVTEIAKNNNNYLQILDKQNGDKLELGQELSFKTSSNALKEFRAQDVFIAEDSVWVGDHISNNSAHHARYSDSEAIAAVNSESTLSVNISGDADTVDGFDASELGVDISNNNSTVVSAGTDINFGGDITASSDGDGTATVSVDDSFVRNTGDTISGNLDLTGEITENTSL